MDNFFNKSTTQVMESLQTAAEGLTTREAAARLQKHGRNELAEAKKKSGLTVFLEQFKDLLVVILIAAGAISLAAGNTESTIVIFAVIILNAVLGTVQHFKAERSLQSLKSLSAPTATVIRDGERLQIPSGEVVPGDMLMLEAGDMVSADGRIIENHSLQINESSLTGESESAEKTDEIIDQSEVALGDRKNMVFSGSMVTYGRGIIAVTATAMDTEIGKIATLMNRTQEKKTPLQISLDNFSKKLAVVIIIISAAVFALSVYRHMPILDSLMFAVALAVAAIPEALSSIVTIVLALGTQKMAEQNAIVKELKSIESLGCVSVICSDKTGTLTQNKMTVTKLFVDGKLIQPNELDTSLQSNLFLLESCVLCNDSVTHEGKEMGDPTEVAFVNFAELYNIDELVMRREIPRIGELPFDSDRKLMSTLHEIGGEQIMFTKGATDVLLGRLKNIHDADGARPITEDDIKLIKQTNRSLSEEGLRVLGFAYKPARCEHSLTTEDECAYTFLGLIGMIDPPRVESKQAVSDCLRAGIKPIMITGDHKVTASSIARQIGILAEGGRAITGTELERMTEQELEDCLEEISVYARVSPEHKIRIVDAWQRRGKITAMTGDGVNDAPALKKADIGIAMGITGTEVSKDAAAMILTDDNFATIIKAVANGRNIYANIKNAIQFLISGNTAGILSVLYTSIFALPVPFAPVHLLFINLLTDSLPAIAIGMEKGSKDILDEHPRDPAQPILTRDFLVQVGVQGTLIAIFTMLAFHMGLRQDGAFTASTMAFAVLALARLFHGFTCRGSSSLAKLGLFTNKYSIMAFAAGVILLAIVLLVPALSGLFYVAALSPAQFGWVAAFAFAPTFIIQVYRMIRGR